MSALGQLIDTAVASAVSEHQKLFDPKQIEKAQRLLVREIMRTLTRDPKADGEQQATAGDAVPASEFLAVDDPRAIAYGALRATAGAVPPRHISDGTVYVPVTVQTPAVFAFANSGPREEWPFVTDRRHLTAWREFFAETLPDISRKEIMLVKDGQHGAHLPWPWPPSKTGRTYETAAEHDSDSESEGEAV